MPNLTNQPKWVEEFEKEFLCQLPECVFKSDHQFAHDKRGILPQAFKDFMSSKFEQIINEIPDAMYTNEENLLRALPDLKHRLRNSWLSN